MSKLLDINGKELQKDIDLAHMDFDKLKDVQFDKQNCPIGTEILGQAIQTLIEKDDVVYKLHLVFGTQVFQMRIPCHEASPEVIYREWMGLMGIALYHFQNGHMYRDQISLFKAAESKAQE